MTRSLVRDKFSSISLLGSLHNPLNASCVVRYLDGSFVVLGMPEFSKLTSTWPPGDATITSLQPWVPGTGKSGNVYRNSYSISDDFHLRLPLPSQAGEVPGGPGGAPPQGGHGGRLGDEAGGDGPVPGR